MPAPKYPLVERGLALARIDFAPSHKQPSAVSVVLATIASVAGSLLADAALVAIGTAVSLPPRVTYISSSMIMRG